MVDHPAMVSRTVVVAVAAQRKLPPTLLDMAHTAKMVARVMAAVAVKAAMEAAVETKLPALIT